MGKEIKRRRRGSDYVAVSASIVLSKAEKLKQITEDHFINRSVAIEAGIDLLIEKYRDK